MTATTAPAVMRAARMSHFDSAVRRSLSDFGAGAEAAVEVERPGTVGNGAPAPVAGSASGTDVPSRLPASPAAELRVSCEMFGSALGIDSSAAVASGFRPCAAVLCVNNGEKVSATVRMHDPTSDDFGCRNFISVPSCACTLGRMPAACNRHSKVGAPCVPFGGKTVVKSLLVHGTMEI